MTFIWPCVFLHANETQVALRSLLQQVQEDRTVAEPTKAPGNADLNNVPGQRPADPKHSTVTGKKRTAPWVWIIGIIILLLIIWAVFGISRQNQVANKTSVPVPAASVR